MKKIMAMVVLCLCSPMLVAANNITIEHLEPLHWWVGMQHPQLQLMVHAKNIASAEPNINYAGVHLVNVEKTSNPNYLFINLLIDKETRAGEFPIQFFKDNKKIAQATYRLENRIAHSAERKGFNTNDSIYLIVPDRFANGNPRNDTQPNLLEAVNRALPGGRHGGDLQGMQQHLNYIANMGFTMVWPTPLTENNQPAYSYHGYSVTNHYQIDARFGNNKDYKQFVAAANKQGLGVILDVVLNHIGSGHWWMKDLPAPDWINFPDRFVATSHRRTTLHDIHAAEADTAQFNEGWFVETMPDLNQRNSLLATYLMQNTVWWIEYANLSGVREDTYSYANKSFLREWGKYVLAEYPNFNMVGEEWTTNTAIVASWQKGKINSNGYESFLPSLMDFPAHMAMRAALVEAEAQDDGLVKLYEALANDFLYADPTQLVVFGDNHDTSRIFSALNENLGLYKNAMVFLATTRGIPQFFYGSEILKTSPKERDDGVVRSDMPGGWRGDTVNAFTGLGLSAPMQEAHAFLTQLLQWRKTQSVIAKGQLLHFAPQQGTYVYFRYDATQTVMVILNKNTAEVSLDTHRFQQMLRQCARGKELLSGAEINLTQAINLKPMTPLIIECQ